ncbi:uncharacterized protein LOC107865994 [Capsicum annuum]|uniref:uncharacterized protein LOC107865994 n=1 Tax=Capsicum annuum TaxID=4072 RepID=UPI001FB0C58F|nr:uncharacterized protein LOC107865994 [Capsicum annuum]XP_047265635.1 uncharacterized protein LOC107865994 [Capsicum annuum]
MLKGIPCPHVVAALHHKKLNPVNYISHWYNRETYMNTYNFFFQPVLDMKMWPQSQNISVMPPPVRKMPGSPGKNRKKEEGETKKKTGKLSKRGIEISCGTFHSKGHNKRRCPTGAPAAGTNANPGPSSSAGADPNAGSSTVPNATPSIGKGRGSTGRGRGRPPKNSTKKCAGRPRVAWLEWDYFTYKVDAQFLITSRLIGRKLNRNESREIAVHTLIRDGQVFSICD